MERLKNYLLKNFEQLFVLLILCATVLVNYYIPQKLAFLNFYFLPIILAGYYLGQRKAVLGAVLCALVISLYVVLNPELFQTPHSMLDVFLNLMVWGGFLIISGSVVGRLKEKLDEKISSTEILNKELERQEKELRRTNEALQDDSVNLEQKVRERTEELEQSKRAVEALKAKVEEALYATMDASVVKLMIEGRLRNDKRNVSVLFSDLAGFTTYSEEHPPETVIQELNRYLGEMEPILLAFHGHIDKYMGDGIMCEFGAPWDFETYRLLAVLAGVKMQEKVASAKYPWQMRVGIASGSAITGLTGSKRQSYTAIGDVVNLAARLEKACPMGRVLIDRQTFEGVQQFVEVRRLRDLPDKDVNDLDLERERRLESLHTELAAQPSNPKLLYEIGRVHLELDEVHEAFSYLERALQLGPHDNAVKLAYAETGMKLKEMEKISVKGKRNRIEAYEVIGLKDPLTNREKIPERVYEEYHKVMDLIQVSDDVLLPVEAMDGSIGHGKVVALLSFAVATILGISESDKRELLLASFLADIGKQIVPYHLLNRKGRLATGEFETVKKHALESAKILRSMGYESDVLTEAVLHSHESYDGSGYPDGLAGEKIPIGARILGVMDAYDALTSWRPYREPWERHAAFDEIRRGAAKGIYDPKVVQALGSLLT
ncbi:MAG: HD domain-containing phosphohydrolase [Nitrospiraceae bacterium]